ncbi:MAG TPA: PASTA domain-containing protein [Bacteroidetes bacterium]|nr:PASTA domain-containing protein [Bacteroidota bacterium]
MSLGRFLISKTFLKNLLFALLISIFLIFLILIWLKLYTRHGQKKEVPDFYGLTVKECQSLIKKGHFVLVVQDSVYTKEVPAGAIVEQNPKAGSMVKKGRKIFLIINAFHPEVIPVPYVVGYSLRQAKALLESNGFQVGKLKYVPDIAINNVLKEMYEERELQPGDSLEKGVSVDLVLGKGLSNEKTPLPDFTGMTLEKAEQVIISTALNKGAIVYDSTVHDAKDSMSAFVWKQSPAYKEKEDLFVPVGSSIYLWFTLDSALLPVPDTLTIEEPPVPNEK